MNWYEGVAYVVWFSFMVGVLDSYKRNPSWLTMGFYALLTAATSGVVGMVKDWESAAAAASSLSMMALLWMFLARRERKQKTG